MNEKNWNFPKFEHVSCETLETRKTFLYNFTASPKANDFRKFGLKIKFKFSKRRKTRVSKKIGIRGKGNVNRSRLSTICIRRSQNYHRHRIRGGGRLNLWPLWPCRPTLRFRLLPCGSNRTFCKTGRPSILV